MEKICNVADSEYSEKHLFISYYAFLKMLPLDFSVGVNKLLGIINSQNNKILYSVLSSCLPVLHLIQLTGNYCFI